MTSRAFMLGSLAIDKPQHSNGAGGGLLRRDLRQAINDRDVAGAVAALGRLAAAALGMIALLASGARAASAAPAAQPTLRMGAMTLSLCTDTPAPGAVYCGRLDRPLDPAGAGEGRLSIYFQLFPHSGPGKAVGMLVATEGGPGYPATQSRDEYLALFGPLRRTRDLLIMDNRGTGKSGALDCPELQTAERWTTALVGACGDLLGERAALFGTAPATDDLAAILAQLGVDKIDLYGDSYGTYFEQVFAVRHPALLRSVVLDGAYPLSGPDYAWYPSYAPTMRDKFDLACRRAPGCAAIPGSSMDHVRPLLAQLRLQPSSAHATDADGKERQFTVDPTHLATVMFGSAPALATVRELDAAARSYVEGDRAPLLRLMAETIGSVDSEDARNSAADITQWSAGLEVAVMCHDPPQIFDMRLAPAERTADRDRVLAERRRSHPDTYAPFTIDEYRGMPLDYSFIDQCVAWPVAPVDHPAGQPTPPNAVYPDVPALVISGELDNMTTPADGAAAAAAFRHGKRVLIANSFHVNALPHARSGCAAGIVRHFIGALEPGDVSCAAEVTPVRLVPRFAVHAEAVDPAIAEAGNAVSDGALKLASAAVQTVGDILVRAGVNASGHGAGLRGGRFEIAAGDGSRRITLDRVRWTEDLAVSGAIDELRDAAGSVRANITIQGPDEIRGTVDVRWEDKRPDAQAHINGEIAGRQIDAHMPAP
jgi:pimeloyl-ACP methyl ester carboxylesterase